MRETGNAHESTRKQKEKGTNMAWKWKEDSGNSNERVYRCEAFRNDREMIKKAQNRAFRLSDIPSEARKALASEARLDTREFENWAQVRDVSIYRESVYVSVEIEKVWMLSNEEDWKWESKGGGGGETVTYTCPGWRCTEGILTKIKNRTISTKDIPMAARDRLASIVELDKNEIGQWGQLTVTADNSRGIFVSIETPNIWITADLLKNGERFVDPFAAIGGSIGAFYHKMMPSGKCKKSCENFQSLLNELMSENNKGKIWGFVLYAHGSRAGAIAETSSSEKKNYQTELLAAVEKYRYKFA